MHYKFVPQQIFVNYNQITNFLLVNIWLRQADAVNALFYCYNFNIIFKLLMLQEKNKKKIS